MAPAHAAGAIVYQGDDYASLSVGGFSGQTFDIVDVYDREADGHGVYVKVGLDDGYDQFGDANGPAPPCSSRTYGRRQVDSIQVCEAITGPDRPAAGSTGVARSSQSLRTWLVPASLPAPTTCPLTGRAGAAESLVSRGHERSRPEGQNPRLRTVHAVTSDGEAARRIAKHRPSSAWFEHAGCWGPPCR